MASARLRPTASTRMRTSPGPGPRRSRSSICSTSGPPREWMRMVRGICVLLLDGRDARVLVAITALDRGHKKGRSEGAPQVGRTFRLEADVCTEREAAALDIMEEAVASPTQLTLARLNNVTGDRRTLVEQVVYAETETNNFIHIVAAVQVEQVVRRQTRDVVLLVCQTIVVVYVSSVFRRWGVLPLQGQACRSPAVAHRSEDPVFKG